MTTKYCRHIDPSKESSQAGSAKDCRSNRSQALRQGLSALPVLSSCFAHFYAAKRLGLAASKLHIQAGQLNLSLGLWQ
jgi:hypothetical protein